MNASVPSPKAATSAESRGSVLRGYTNVGATLIDILDSYADALARVGGRLYLSGVDEEVNTQLRRAGKLDLDKVVHLVLEDDVIGASTQGSVKVRFEAVK